MRSRRWASPGKVTPDSSSDQIICLTDFFATFSELTGKPLPTDSAEDSLKLYLWSSPIFNFLTSHFLTLFARHRLKNIRLKNAQS